MRMSKTAARFISILLIIVAVMGTLPVSVFAQTLENKKNADVYRNNLLNNVVKSEEKAEIVAEVIEKREEYTKTYERADGTFTKVISKTPLHNRVENDWNDIDNSLVKSGNIIKNNNGVFSVEFPEVISEDKSISLEVDGQSIAFALNGVSQAQAAVSENISADDDSNDIILRELGKTVSEIIYSEAANGTDIQYIVSPNTLKENIIIKNKASLKKSYAFEIEKGSLRVESDGQNGILLKNAENETVFTIPAPVMTDASGAVSYEIETRIENAGENVFNLTYLPSESWLASPERAYPVVLDPVIGVGSDWEDVFIDVPIFSSSNDVSSKNTNYLNAPVTYVAKNYEAETGGEIKNGDLLVKIGSGMIDDFRYPGKAVTEARFISVAASLGGKFLLKEINEAWDENTITYESVYPSEVSGETGTVPSPVITYSSESKDYCVITRAEGADSQGLLNFNITELFNNWLYGEKANNGFAIVAADEDSLALTFSGGYFEGNNGNRTYFHSYLAIDYIDASGENPNYMYRTQDIGRAGTGSVNIFTRALSLSRSDIGITGNRMPATVSMNYGSAFDAFWDAYKAYALRNDTPDAEEALFPYYGTHWYPSYLRTILLLDTGAVYFDGNGALLDFNLKSTTKTVTEDGTETEVDVSYFEENASEEFGSSGYTLELINPEGEVDFSNIIMTTPNGEVEYFDESGRVYMIKSADDLSDEADKITIEYSENNDYMINSVTDGSGRKYIFNYSVYSESNSNVNGEEGSGGNTTGNSGNTDEAQAESKCLLESITCVSADGTNITAGSTADVLKTEYVYNGKELVTVKYPGGEEINYSYTVQESNPSVAVPSGLISEVRDTDGYKIKYSYDALGKVTKISEYAKNGDSYVSGNTITATPTDSCRVKFSDSATGTVTYQFKKSGALKYTLDDRGNYIKNVSSDETTINTGEEQTLASNYLKNASFEIADDNSKPQGWSNTFSVSTLDVFEGEKACHLKQIGNAAAAKYTEQTVSVLPGIYYTFSIYAKAVANGSRITLKVSEIDFSNTEHESKTKSFVVSTSEYEKFALTLKTTSNTAKLKVGFGFDSGESGEVFVDCTQLEKGEGGAAYNYISNGMLTNPAAETLGEWNGNAENTAIVSSSIGGEPVNALKISGVMPECVVAETSATLVDSICALTRRINVIGKKGEGFTFGGMFNGRIVENELSQRAFLVLGLGEEALPLSKTHERTVQIKATYSYTEETENEDGTKSTTTKTEETAAVFDKDISGWQLSAQSFVLKGDIEYIDITVMCKNISADAMFTGFMLVKDSAVLDLGSNEENGDETDDQNESGLLEPEICSCGCEDCTFGENCPCKTLNGVCECPECLRKTETQKDSFGNEISTVMRDGNKYISTAATYTADGNYPLSVTDENGAITEYNYNVLNGLLTSVRSRVASRDYNTTTYCYNSAGLIESESAPVRGYFDENATQQSLSYEYSHGRPTKVTTDTESYILSYDIWGQLSSVSVKNGESESVTVVSYEYGSGANRARVNSVTYYNSASNPTVYNYYYNSAGNLISTELNENAVHTFIYNNKGELICIENDGGRTVYYENGFETVYDADGSVMYKTEASDLGIVESFFGNGIINDIGDEEYLPMTGVTTKSGTVSLLSANANGEKEVTAKIIASSASDWFGRQLSSTTSFYEKSDGNDILTATSKSNYEYPDLSNGKTSSRPTAFVNSVYFGGGSSASDRTYYKRYAYTYGYANNVVSESVSSSSTDVDERKSYSYDSLGQLIRFNDKDSYKTYIYEYDRAGNITKKSEYIFTAASDVTSAPLEELTFGYAGVWGDRLVRVGSETDNIIYDNAGNPTSYLGASLVWRARQLMSYEKGSKKVTFSYDENGLRYSKNVYESNVLKESYRYIWNDSRLSALKVKSFGVNNEVSILTSLYIYDDFGNLSGFALYGSEGLLGKYFYIKNLFGDITAIVNANGVVQATYAYDAWGALSLYMPEESSLSQNELRLANTFGFRGYCYDADIEMYYLQSRYYDPSICRFINADDVAYLGATGTLLSYNLFAYCENDPVNGLDSNGTRNVTCEYSYNKKKALSYASKYWNYRNTAYYSYSSRGGDCANFVSQCIYAGGLIMDSVWYSKRSKTQIKGWDKQRRTENGRNTSYWYNVSAAWRAAPKLFEYLVQKKRLYYIKITSYSQLKTRLNQGVINDGDVAFFADSKNSVIKHAVIVGRVVNNSSDRDVYYFAHTSNRNAYDCAKKKTNGFYTQLKPPKGKNQSQNVIYVVRMR